MRRVQSRSKGGLLIEAKMKWGIPWDGLSLARSGSEVGLMPPALPGRLSGLSPIALIIGQQSVSSEVREAEKEDEEFSPFISSTCNAHTDTQANSAQMRHKGSICTSNRFI